MCNLYTEKVSYRQLFEEFSQLRLPLLFPPPEAAPNLEPHEEVKPTDPGRVIRPRGDGVELVELKWGFRPARPKAAPVINFRSDGRRFGRGRCLVPASCFYEFTGTSYPKTRWRFTVPGRDWFCLAGLWRPAEGDWPDSFTLLTSPPGPDMAPYHDRQVVVVPPEHWPDWLDPEADPEPMLRVPQKGMLKVQEWPRQRQG
jgi:putative SOS response-associated peptidase YedK